MKMNLEKNREEPVKKIVTRKSIDNATKIAPMKEDTFNYKVDLLADDQKNLVIGQDNNFSIKLTIDKNFPKNKQLNSFYAMLHANGIDMDLYNRVCQFQFNENFEADCNFTVTPDKVGETDLFFDIIQNSNIFERIPLHLKIITP